MRKLLFMLFATVVLYSYATDIYLSTKDGGSFVFEVTDKSKITFSSNELSITQGDITNKFDLANVSSLKYSDNQTSNQLSMGLLDVQVADGEIIISNINANETVSLCDVAGVQLKTYVPDKSGSVKIGISDLANGIYIIKAKDTSYKFLKTK